MKKVNNKEKKQEYYSFAEYKKNFYPASSEQQLLRVLKADDSYQIGVNLARESLNKFKKFLLQE